MSRKGREESEYSDDELDESEFTSYTDEGEYTYSEESDYEDEDDESDTKLMIGDAALFNEQMMRMKSALASKSGGELSSMGIQKSQLYIHGGKQGSGFIIQKEITPIAKKKKQIEKTPVKEEPKEVLKKPIVTKLVSKKRKVKTPQTPKEPKEEILETPTKEMEMEMEIEEPKTEIKSVLKVMEKRKKRRLTEKELIEKEENSKKPIGIDTGDVPKFLMAPIPRNSGVVNFSIKRVRKWGRLNPFPKYLLFLEDGNKFLLSARRRTNSRTPHYVFSTDPSEFTRKGDGFIGKLRGNFVGTEFHLFDGGDRAVKAKNDDDIRKMYAAVKYEKNILGSQGPRKMKVVIPRIAKGGGPLEVPQKKNTENLLEMADTGNLGGIIVFQNNLPKWKEEIQSYVLNFNGRVSKASVKNFQIIDPRKNDGKILMQFGRIARDKFVMDIAYPFNPFQAFAIAMTSCDNKLLTE